MSSPCFDGLSLGTMYPNLPQVRWGTWGPKKPHKTYLSFFNVGQMVEKELPLTGQSEKSTTTPRNARLEMISSIICGQSVEHLACPHVLVSNSRGKQNELTLF